MLLSFNLVEDTARTGVVVAMRVGVHLMYRKTQDDVYVHMYIHMAVVRSRAEACTTETSSLNAS